MESVHYFKIYYGNVFVCGITAHTKWEAVDRAYYKFISDSPHLERSKFKAKKMY
jgi:hypothetical protein